MISIGISQIDFPYPAGSYRQLTSGHTLQITPLLRPDYPNQTTSLNTILTPTKLLLIHIQYQLLTDTLYGHPQSIIKPNQLTINSIILDT